MPDGVMKNEHHIDSTSPSQPFFQFAPVNIREMIQRQVQTTLDHDLNLFVDLSIGDFDGRFLNQYPGNEEFLGDDNGNVFFVVGKTLVGDPAVAAP